MPLHSCFRCRGRVARFSRNYSDFRLWAEKRAAREERQAQNLRRRRIQQGAQDAEPMQMMSDQRLLCRDVSELARARQWEEAVSLFATEPEPNAVLASAAITACAKAYQPHAARQIFDDMPVKTVPAYNILINMYGRMRDTSVAESLVQEMQQQCLKPSVVTYTSLINAYGMTHQVDDALRTLDMMHQQGIPVDRVAHSSALAAAARGGDKERAWELLAKMDELSLEPDEKQFTSIIASCCLSKDEPRARKTLEEMRRRGLKPDITTFTVLISCLAGPDTMQKAEAIVAEMRQEGIESDSFIYNTLLQLALESQEYQRFSELLEEMDSKGLPRGRQTEILVARWTRQTEEAASESAALPAGWFETLDPTSGRPYYWKQSDPSGTTTWVRPS